MFAIPQIIAALVIGVCYYMLAVAMTVYDGLFSLIFQPLIGAIYSGIAIFILLILGLPIRLSSRINGWWRRHWWIPIAIGTVAFIVMCSSWHPYFRVRVMDPELDMMVDSLNPVLSIFGWLLTLFAVLHFYPQFPQLKRPTK